MIQAPSKPVTLIFDGDSSLWGEGDNDRCSLCGSNSASYVRVREKRTGQSELVGHVCPTCVARMVYQVERLGWWKLVKTSAMAAFKRLATERANLVRRSEQTLGYFNIITDGRVLGHRPEPKTASKALDKLVPKLPPRK
jgi:hypothetical protein